MIKVLLSDFSRTLLFPKDDTYLGSLNDLYKSVKVKEGFSFFNYFTWNQELADYYLKLKQEQNIELSIFTTDKIQDDTALAPYIKEFSKVIKVADIGGFKKDNPEAYRNVCKLLNLQPEQVLFIDDSAANLKSASEIGMKTLQYTSVSQLQKDF